MLDVYFEPMLISIHALVKRATAFCGVSDDEDDFNPRPREEGDLAFITDSRLVTLFQSTPS